MSTGVRFATKSEELFATYLDEAKHPWDYEPPIPGQTKRPDFQIHHGALDVLCDVKERAPTDMPLGPRCFDPMEGVRKLIDQGRKKFKSFDAHLCALVVYNNGDHDTRLYPFCIFGAMLGVPGIQMPFDPESGTLDGDATQNVFLPRRGEMVRHYAPLEPHDSTRNISAIIALETYRIPNPLYDQAFSAEVAAKGQELGRPLTADEQFSIHYDLLQQMRMTLGDAPRLTVCLNPFARHQFPDDLFKGPYDERWAIVDGTLTRVFAGEHRQSTEDE